MAKKNKISGSNLRILSIAYAGGRIDRTTYLRLRTQQLGALEFDKPLPELPANLLEIDIPTVKVDSSHVDIKKHTGNRLWLHITTTVVIIAAIAAGLWYGDIIPGKSEKPRQVKQLEPFDYAQRLLQNPDWNERDVNAFLRSWGTRTPAAKANARNSNWYLSLENEIIKRINKSRLQLETDPGSVIAQRELADLRRFYGQLSSN
ncbi:MAG: hypothetical protein JXA04_01535 [Gammaproteobacteria bacterium]|nr:hypothetical protein [Gammaproteobacteria bacterium]